VVISYLDPGVLFVILVAIGHGHHGVGVAAFNLSFFLRVRSTIRHWRLFLGARRFLRESFVEMIVSFHIVRKWA